MASAITPHAASYVPSKEMNYACFHARKGPPLHVTAPSSYQAAQKAASAWGLKSTAGVTAVLMDGTICTGSL
jgi:hypothetical protein